MNLLLGMVERLFTLKQHAVLHAGCRPCDIPHDTCRSLRALLPRSKATGVLGYSCDRSPYLGRRVRSGTTFRISFCFGCGRSSIFGGVLGFFAFAVGAGFAVACTIAAALIIGDMPAGALKNNPGWLEYTPYDVATLRAYPHRLIRKFLKLFELMPTRIAAINIRRHTFVVILLVHNHRVLYRSHEQSSKQSEYKLNVYKLKVGTLDRSRTHSTFLPIPCPLFPTL